MKKLLLFLLISLSPASAEELKIITTGGGVAVNARLVGKYISKYLPNTPTVIVQQMPGAGGLTSANYLYNVAKKDGSEIGTINKLVLQQRNSENAKFKLNEFNWLGSSSDGREDSIVFWTNTDKQDNLIVGVEGPGEGNPIVLASKLMRFNTKIINGYSGSNAVKMALQRGEIDGAVYNYMGVKTTNPEWLTSNTIRPMFQFGHKLKGVPSVDDYGQSEELDIMNIESTMSRLFALPPGVPADKAEEIRKAFEQTVHDQGYIDEAEKLGIDVKLINSKEVNTLIDKYLKF
jgi:tripartite-type tricarboxylate transporter receptor subunit TctC